MASVLPRNPVPAAPSVRYRYDRAQRGFHWLMAAVMIVALGLGVWAAFLPAGTSPRREILEIHKSLGMSVLALVPLRILYRLMLGEPAYRVPPGRLTHATARAAHLGLYGLMLFLPLTGYLNSAAGGYSLPWFGLFSWPRLVPSDKALSHLGESLHYRGGWVVGLVLALHVLAVAWHHWVKRDEVLSRMLPDRTGSARST